MVPHGDEPRLDHLLKITLLLLEKMLLIGSEWKCLLTFLENVLSDRLEKKKKKKKNNKRKSNRKKRPSEGKKEERTQRGEKERDEQAERRKYIRKRDIELSFSLLTLILRLPLPFLPPSLLGLF